MSLYRQGVISVFQSTGNSQFSSEATTEIIFRQPFNNLGLGFTFSFERKYFSPFSVCTASIINPSNQIVDAFNFDPVTYKNRPLVEIRAGYSDVKIQSASEVNALKASLPLRYSGHPTFSQDFKLPGGRELRFQLSDIQASSRSARVGKQYKKGKTIISIIEDLLKIGGAQGDLTALKNDSAFSGLTLENSVLYNNRQIFTQVLPELAKRYLFTFVVENQKYIFKLADKRGPAGALIEISENTGMIEYPVSINWVHWIVKTLYGKPAGVRRGGWTKVISKVFNPTTGPVSPTGSEITALVVDEKHIWGDEQAAIEYVISPEGQPINAIPILNL
jgi:hypothetical protein